MSLTNDVCLFCSVNIFSVDKIIKINDNYYHKNCADKINLRRENYNKLREICKKNKNFNTVNFNKFFEDNYHPNHNLHNLYNKYLLQTLNL
jgi:hypothetical protein